MIKKQDLEARAAAWKYEFEFMILSITRNLEDKFPTIALSAHLCTVAIYCSL